MKILDEGAWAAEPGPKKLAVSPSLVGCRRVVCVVFPLLEIIVSSRLV